MFEVRTYMLPRSTVEICASMAGVGDMERLLSREAGFLAISLGLKFLTKFGF